MANTWKPTSPDSMSDASLPQHATHHLIVHLEKDGHWISKPNGVLNSPRVAAI